MEARDPIELALERLIPSGFSDEGAAALDSLIDELAAEDAPQTSWRRLFYLGAGTAAAGITVVLGLAFANDPIVEFEQVEWDDSELLLVAELEGVISAERDEAWVADEDGSLHQAWRMQVVSEERFHDAQTGSEVRVLHPREEIVLMPVTAF